MAHGLSHANRHELVYVLDDRQPRRDRYAGAVGGLLQLDPRVDRRHVGVRDACFVAEAILELQGVRLVEDQEAPPSVGLLAVGSSHVADGPAAADDLVLLGCRRPGRRAPSPLELTQVDPDLPRALQRCGEIGDDRHGWPSMRAAARMVRMVVTSPDTICSRPRHVRHPVSVFEDCDVLLDRGEAHVLVPSECGHRRLVAQHARADVSAGRVGGRGEDLIRGLSLDPLRNQVVVRYPIRSAFGKCSVSPRRWRRSLRH
jgi:hypothetical protein